MSRSRKIVKPKGSIDLSIIIAVRPSLAPKAPIWSLDVLTSTGEIYILGTENKQEQLFHFLFKIDKTPLALLDELIEKEQKQMVADLHQTGGYSHEYNQNKHLLTSSEQSAMKFADSEYARLNGSRQCIELLQIGSKNVKKS